MLDTEIRRKLAKVIETHFPPNLTDEQAVFWIENPDYIPNAIADLAKVIVLKKVSQNQSKGG